MFFEELEALKAWPPELGTPTHTHTYIHTQTHTPNTHTQSHVNGLGIHVLVTIVGSVLWVVNLHATANTRI